MRVLPKVEHLLVDKGLEFTNSFSSNPTCCPSRATYLTGQYSHNNGVYRNEGAHGGFAALDGTKTLPVWLERGGYAPLTSGSTSTATARTRPRSSRQGGLSGTGRSTSRPTRCTATRERERDARHLRGAHRGRPRELSDRCLCRPGGRRDFAPSSPEGSHSSSRSPRLPPMTRFSHRESDCPGSGLHALPHGTLASSPTSNCRRSPRSTRRTFPTSRRKSATCRP